MKKLPKWQLVIIVIIMVVIFLFLLWKILFNTEWLDLERKTYENSRYNFSLKYPQEWILGEQEINNAGREFYSPDGKALCYAYGFNNALVNEQGEPQNLNEFIDWLTKDVVDIKETLQRENSVLASNPAIKLFIEETDGYKQAIYTLGKETGIGFYCIYSDFETAQEYSKEFDNIIRSFDIKLNLDGEDIRIGMYDCQNLLNGAIEPLKDLQTFIDDKYTEVTITSREAWNKNKLPEQVLNLEKQNYKCYPMPLEFDYSDQEGDELIQPEVTTVEWQCELNYQKWQYLAIENTSQKTNLEKQGYKCEKEQCLGEGPEDNEVWLCAK